MSADKQVLTATDVSFATPDGRMLGEHIDISLGAGEILLITGANGSGKTSLLNILLGKRAPVSGIAKINVAASGIGYLPQLQDSEMHIPVTLRDVINIAFPQRLGDEAICAFGLLNENHMSLNWNRASGGEKRRTLLTRTFMQQPDLLILDEPFNHLDTDSRRVIVAAIHHFISDQQKSAILVTHEGFERYAQSDFSNIPMKKVAL